MAIPLFKNSSGNASQFGTGDSAQVASVTPRTPLSVLSLGDSGGASFVGPITTLNILSDSSASSRDIGSAGNGYNEIYLTAVGSGGSPLATARALSANGVATAGASLIGVDTTTMTNSSPGATDLQTVLQALDGAITGTTFSLPINDGVTIAAGDIVASGTSGTRVTLASAASGSLSINILGVAVTGGTGDSGGTVLASIRPISGRVTSATGLTAGSPVYLSTASPGDVTTTAPTGAGNVSLRLGFAYSATSWVFSVGEPIVLT